MDIVFLDQNKWVELARVRSGRKTSGHIADLFPQLVAAVQKERVIFPLSISNIMETAKRNDPDSRRYVAETQALLSRGYAHRSRADRVAIELRLAIQRTFGPVPVATSPSWALVPNFIQAFGPVDELTTIPEELASLSRKSSPSRLTSIYLDFMINQSDSRRRKAILRWTRGLTELIARIENRRTHFSNKSIAFRRDAYAAQAWSENINIINQVVGTPGYFEQLSSLGHKSMRALLEDIPTMNVEVEMATRLESKAGALSVNDVLDIHSFYTAIPYVNVVVAEKAAISYAKQAKLDSKYGVVLSRSLDDLLDRYLD